MKTHIFLSCLLLASFLVGSFSYNVSYPDSGPSQVAIIDLHLKLESLQAPMDFALTQKFITACQVFLESSLNIIPTTIINIQAAVGSQTLGTVPSGTFNNPSDPTFFPLHAFVQVLIDFRVDSGGSSKLNDMLTRVQVIFSNEWEELMAMMLLLDPVSFAAITKIELESSSYLSNADKNSSPRNNNGSQIKMSQSTVIIFLAVSLGVVVSLALTIPRIIWLKARHTRR